jgi:hypothetical protein
VPLRRGGLTNAQDVVLSHAIEEKQRSDASLSEGVLFEEKVSSHAIYGAVLSIAIVLLLVPRGFLLHGLSRIGLCVVSASFHFRTMGPIRPSVDRFWRSITLKSPSWSGRTLRSRVSSDTASSTSG